MPLKDAEIRALRAEGSSKKKADAKGLYVEVFPNGSKLWRLKYRVAGREKRLALGAYPEVSLEALTTGASTGKNVFRWHNGGVINSTG